jgi:flavorubredoxin
MWLHGGLAVSIVDFIKKIIADATCKKKAAAKGSSGWRENRLK